MVVIGFLSTYLTYPELNPVKNLTGSKINFHVYKTNSFRSTCINNNMVDPISFFSFNIV